jgi:hypothetical protein
VSPLQSQHCSEDVNNSTTFPKGSPRPFMHWPKGLEQSLGTFPRGWVFHINFSWSFLPNYSGARCWSCLSLLKCVTQVVSVGLRGYLGEASKGWNGVVEVRQLILSMGLVWGGSLHPRTKAYCPQVRGFLHLLLTPHMFTRLWRILFPAIALLAKVKHQSL